jgi:hypothetical protein
MPSLTDLPNNVLTHLFQYTKKENGELMRMNKHISRALTPLYQQDTFFKRMSHAIKAGKLDAVKLLLAIADDSSALKGYVDANLKGAFLHQAIKNAQPEISQLLIESGANVDFLNEYGSTALHQINNLDAGVINKLDSLIPLLIAKSKDLNARDDEGNTPLRKAAVRHYTLLVYHLVQAKADATIPNNAGECSTDIHYFPCLKEAIVTNTGWEKAYEWKKQMDFRRKQLKEIDKYHGIRSLLKFR